MSDICFIEDVSGCTVLEIEAVCDEDISFIEKCIQGPEGAQGPTGPAGPGFISPAQDVVDVVSSTVIYKGFAELLTTATSDPLWQIEKYEEVLGVWTKTHPNGSLLYTFVWDDRLILTYS